MILCEIGLFAMQIFELYIKTEKKSHSAINVQNESILNQLQNNLNDTHF